MTFQTMCQRALAAAALTALIAAAGCRVETSKHDGGSEDVKMDTPFGGMQVKTDEKAVASSVGLPLYPGAVPVKKKDGSKDDGAADINMSFGSFQMRIKAMSFHSEDPQDKIAAFYRPALAKYGDVIQCSHDRPVGEPTHTSQGLTCDDSDNKKNVHIASVESGNFELKTGSKQHQHIVGLEKDGSGTKIGLVALDLPGHLSFGNSSSDDDKQ